MRQRFQRMVPTDFLCLVAAKDAADGGSRSSVSVRIHFLRRNLLETPFAIANDYGRGYGLFWLKDVLIEETSNFAYWCRLKPQEVSHDD